MDKFDVARIAARVLVGLWTVAGIYIAYRYFPTDEFLKVAIAAGATLIGSGVIVATAAASVAYREGKREEHDEVTSGRSLSEFMADLFTDVLVAVFLAICVSVLLEGVARYEKSHEPIKEALTAANVALVSFAILIMMRAALSVQHLGKVDVVLGQARTLADEVIHLHDRALKLSAEGGAGTALAQLIKQVAPDDIQSAIWKEQREILTAAGTSAYYWVSYAREDARKDDVEQARPIVRFTAAKAFLRESASDMARQERLAVSNIRYVTSLVCSTLIALQKLAAKRGSEWRPVWFGLTTYPPDLWFEDPLVLPSSNKFLEGSGLPDRTIHLQYWGRYLRNLRYLMQGNQAPISLRIFSSKESDFDKEKQQFKDLFVLDCLHPYNGGGEKSRLTQFVPGKGRHPFSRKFAQELAEKLALDAVLSIKDEKLLQTERGGELKNWLCDLFNKQKTEKTEWSVPEFLQAWHKEHSGRIAEIVSASFEEMHAWELTYFSQRPNDTKGPTIRAETAEAYISRKTNKKVVLDYVDGNPLEVLLDALLLYCDAVRDSGTAKTASSLLVERWHREAGSRACRIAKPATEPPEFLTPEQMLDGLVFNLPEHGDIHAFGLVPIRGHTTANASVEWDRAEWLLAAKSGMSSLLGIARVDFLEIDNLGQIFLAELRNPIGRRLRNRDPVRLSKIVAELAIRQEEADKKFEILS